MKRPLRVLLVEDSAIDAELIVHALHRAGFDPQWQRVQTEPAFLEQLGASVDIVISDSNLPQFDGQRALELRNQSGLDLPFILISGSITDDSTEAARQHGVSDHLPKDQLTRLGPAVEQALEACRLRKEKRKEAAAPPRGPSEPR